MRRLAAAAAVLLALPSFAAAAGESQPVATSAGQDDAFAQASRPPPREPGDTVVVRGVRPPSPPDKLLVASTAPAQVFEDDETDRNIDLFINGPVRPAHLGEGEPPPCDETPHGEVGASIGGGSYGTGGGGYATVVKPIMHCRGVVAISVAGSRFSGGRRGW